ncbi:c-type cytochrome [uncultured Roseibium sp.]|uniref:c-type cytochrome n=1 Tax=uncultured Roseibium sp. TaxID=1936171 RepID=UPI003216D476
MLRSVILALGGVFLAQGVLNQSAFAQMPAGDPAEGRKKATMCRTCHGIEGLAKIPIAPNIGGEPASYISRQLIAFRAGARTHEMMSVVAKSLDDQTIADVAAWYAEQKASATLPAGKTDAQAPETCVACHGTEGIATMEDAPNLAGETVMYLDTQLKAFRGGKRTHEIMSDIAADLSDEDIRELAEWYSGIKLNIEKAK